MLFELLVVVEQQVVLYHLKSCQLFRVWRNIRCRIVLSFRIPDTESGYGRQTLVQIEKIVIVIRKFNTRILKDRAGKIIG